MGARPAAPDYNGVTPLPDQKQELFCVLYTSNTTPRFFGHGEHSYAFAYGYQQKIDALEEKMPGARTATGRGVKKKKSELSLLEIEVKKIKNVCRVGAAQSLIRPNIKARCNFLMDSLFTEEIMDRELVYVMQQRHDLNSKVRAWEMASKLKQRIREKVDIQHEFVPIEGFNYIAPDGTPVLKQKK